MIKTLTHDFGKLFKILCISNITFALSTLVIKLVIKHLQNLLEIWHSGMYNG